MNPQTTEFCYICGFTGTIDRGFLRKELSKFGEIRKIFTPVSEDYAKVYFKDSYSTKNAFQSLKQNLYGWRVTIGQDNRTNSESGSVSKMYDEEVDVENSSERLYTVHGEYIECFGDGMGNMYVNLEEVRRSGFAVYSEEELNFSLEQKRGIILDDFYQYMLSQAMNYLNKNKEVHKYIREEQILNTIERCRMKLLGEGRESDYNNDRSVNQNLKITVPNRQEPQDRFGGSRESNFGKNISFNGDSPSLRSPQSLPNNFVPTQTQRNTAMGTQSQSRSRDSSFNNHRRDNSGNNRQRFNQNRNSRSSTRRNNEENRDNRGQSKSKQNYKSNASNNDEEFWGCEKPGPKQQSQEISKDNQVGNNRQNVGSNSSLNRKSESNQFDTISQKSDGSEKKERLMKSLEAVDPMGKIDLEINKTYEVQISEKENNKVCWVQKTESSTELEELHLAIMEEISELKVLEDLKKGQLGLADFEDVWCRCRVMSLNPLSVIFVDYGNRENVTEIKELPDRFKKIPALAIRLAVTGASCDIETYKNIKIKVKTKYDDDTYLVDAQETSNSETPKHEKPISETAKEENPIKPTPEEKPIAKHSTPSKIENTVESESKTEKCYVDLPKPLVELKNNDKVMLLDIVGDRMAVKTKECVQKSKELLEYIKTLNKSDLMLKEVKEGQLVLGSRDGLPNLCRAVVIEKQSPTVATIKYLDYAGSESLSIKSLRNVDDYLATQPITLILTPEMEVINNITEKSVDFIVSLIEKKEKGIVVLSEDNDFDIKLEDGTLFTQKLFELEKPNVRISPKLVPSTDVTSTSKAREPEKPKAAETPVVPTPEPTASTSKSTVSAPISDSDDTIVTFGDMDYIKPKVGSTASYVCYTIKDLSEITLISLEEDSVEYMKDVSELDIKDNKPYKPEVHEMCVFLYKTPDEPEPAWYRGVVMDKEDDDEYSISMVDFGNLVTVTSKDIRKFPARLKDIPMLGIFCELINIPHTPEILEAIKKLVTEGEDVEVTIKEENDLTYGIELPTIYKELKKLKLL